MMEKLTTTAFQKEHLEKQQNPDEESDWILTSIISIGCLLFLIIAIKLCYNYSRKFPEQKNDPEELANLNVHGISFKGTRGVRYSVA
ncbi:unnamed protein product [Caenorhabditis angaria]|uniref:Uncharacterized protein n=1 Tax=Caenorhabditis angaria TaxID=860376 RepID=A0A9P1IWK1_9PELO|nr:unnamed protein product [Caenorhabditis angaria]